MIMDQQWLFTHEIALSDGIECGKIACCLKFEANS